MKIIIDTNEKKPWLFSKSDCIHANMETGDYTLEGFENILSIERKGHVSEFYHNICSNDLARFKRELDRLSLFKYAYVILCFSMRDILLYPQTTDLPFAIKKRIGSKGDYFLRQFITLQVKYPNISFLFCDTTDGGKKVAISLFKRVIENEQS